MKDKFDLPSLPTHLSIVKPPRGTELLNGIVKNDNFGGSGMGTQFYFTKPVDKTGVADYFKKAGKIENLKNR